MWYTYAIKKIKSEIDKDQLASARAYRLKTEEQEHIYNTTHLPKLVATLAAFGQGPVEIARRLRKSLETVIQALHLYEKQNPGFLQSLLENLDDNETKLRSLNISPSEYDYDAGILKANDDYERVRDPYSRVDTEDNYTQVGMPFNVNMEELDPSLKGWKGVHVGDAEDWFPILVRDQFVNDPAHHYTIKSDEVPMFEMEDPHPIDKGEVPASWIIFTHPEFLEQGNLPGKYLEYQKPLYMSDYPNEEEDDENEWDDEGY